MKFVAIISSYYLFAWFLQLGERKAVDNLKKFRYKRQLISEARTCLHYIFNLLIRKRHINRGQRRTYFNARTDKQKELLLALILTTIRIVRRQTDVVGNNGFHESHFESERLNDVQGRSRQVSDFFPLRPYVEKRDKRLQREQRQTRLIM